MTIHYHVNIDDESYNIVWMMNQELLFIFRINKVGYWDV